MESSAIKVHWWQIYNEYFGGALSAESADIWTDELFTESASVNTNNEEICEAIRHHVNTNKERRYGKPSLEHLRIWIFTYKKSLKLNGTTMTAQEWLDQVFDSMKRAYYKQGFMAAWSIMCSPEFTGFERTTTAKECDVLFSQAKKVFPDYRRPTWNELGGGDMSKAFRGKESEKISVKAAIKENLERARI